MVGSEDEQPLQRRNGWRPEIFRRETTAVKFGRRQLTGGVCLWRVRPKRKKVQTVRLGGRRRGAFLVRTFRQLRLGWTRTRASLVLKKLKALYHRLVNELVEATAGLDTKQARFLQMDSYFAAPMMPLSLPSSLVL